MDMLQATAEVQKLTAEVVKIKDGVDALVQRIADLTAVIEAGGAGNTTPEFDAGLAALKEQVAVVRGLVPTVEA